ncbi:hypothetical protein [Dielma fastidiosa]|uniref:hypothetical protein n=1 Tax=Dielma fastidiosa TaxID=1034346 RepID=UPI000E554197|nr:hypothetical protein [Dielma fastidiosa]RHN00857.1 hypothetical protein DWZ33_08480 [Dielma fastidiosa]
MEVEFYRIKDLQYILGVSKSRAAEIIKRIQKYYELDENKLPTKASIPVTLFNDYYDFSDKLKKGKKGNDS